MENNSSFAKGYGFNKALVITDRKLKFYKWYNVKYV